MAFFFDVSAAFESIGTDRVPIFDRPVSGRETLSQLVFVLALHFVQHLDGSPPGHGQSVQTHCCSLLQPQRWPTSAPVMSRPGSDDSPGSSPLAAPAAAAEDARDQALSLAREAVQAEVAAFGEEQREELRLKLKSLDEVEGGFGTALMESFPDFLPKPEMLGKTRGTLAQLAVLFKPEQAELSAILTLGVGRSAGGVAELLEKCEEGMIKVLARIEEQMVARGKR